MSEFVCDECGRTFTVRPVLRKLLDVDSTRYPKVSCIFCGSKYFHKKT